MERHSEKEEKKRIENVKKNMSSFRSPSLWDEGVGMCINRDFKLCRFKINIFICSERFNENKFRDRIYLLKLRGKVRKSNPFY